MSISPFEMRSDITPMSDVWWIEQLDLQVPSPNGRLLYSIVPKIRPLSYLYTVRALCRVPQPTHIVLQPTVKRRPHRGTSTTVQLPVHLRTLAGTCVTCALGRSKVERLETHESVAVSPESLLCAQVKPA